jgi:hypothetical protein
MGLTIVGSTIVPATAQVDDPPPRTSGRSGGTRGCSITETPQNYEIPALMLLAPTTTIGGTTLTTPTFTWFIRDAEPMAMAFGLYRHGPGLGAETIFEVADLQSTQGLTVMTLPETIPSLEQGSDYFWKVELVCDPEKPAANLLAVMDVHLQTLPSTLQTELSQLDLSTPAGQEAVVALYQKAGLWYNALAQALSPQVNSNPEIGQVEQGGGAMVNLTERDSLAMVRSALFQEASLSPGEQQALETSPIQVIPGQVIQPQ